MKRANYSVSWVEILIACVVFLVLGRSIWAQELARFETTLFESLGIDEGVKYLITIPLFFWMIYRRYQADAKKVQGTGRSVIGSWVIVFILFSIFALGLYVWFLSG